MQANESSGESPSRRPTQATLDHYAALQSAAARIDFGQRTQIELLGRDRQRFLHNLCTNEIVRLPVGGGCEAFATNVQGKCVGHLFVFQGAESLVVETVPQQAARLLPHWDRYLITEDVQLIDRSELWSEWLLSGPQLESCLAGAGVAELPTALFSHRAATVGGVACWLRRVPILSQPTWLASCPRTEHERLGEALVAAGLVAGATIEAERESLEMARIEAGFPWYGPDISDKTLPQEVQRDAATLNFQKGCYLGQETIARLDAMGHVNRVLVNLVCDVSEAPAPHEPLTVDGQTVGEVTSAAFSPQHQAPLAFAYLRVPFSQPGQIVQLPQGTARVVRPQA